MAADGNVSVPVGYGKSHFLTNMSHPVLGIPTKGYGYHDNLEYLLYQSDETSASRDIRRSFADTRARFPPRDRASLQALPLLQTEPTR